MKTRAKIPKHYAPPPADKGVYIGTRVIRDKNGISLGLFNVYAARQDLTDNAGTELTLTFNQAAAAMSKLRNWNGHDGSPYQTEDALLDALKRDVYAGEWVIPTQDIMLENLRPNRERDGIAGTFKGAGDWTLWYWTCTMLVPGVSAMAVTYRTNVTPINIDFRCNNSEFAVRPVRLEKV